MVIALYFSREFVEKYSENHLKIRKKYEKSIKDLKTLQNKIINEKKGTASFEEYLKAKQFYTALKKDYFSSKENEKVFGFLNIKSFLFKLGPNVFWFGLILFCIYRSFYFERKNLGIKMLLTTALSLTLYEFYYIFQPVQDLSLFNYYLMGLSTSILITIAIYYNSKYQESYINVLKQRILKLADFTIKNTKENKKAEMVRLLDSLKNEK